VEAEDGRVYYWNEETGETSPHPDPNPNPHPLP